MSFKFLATLAICAVALAAPRAADSLTVSISPIAGSAKSSDVALNATITNPTDKDIKVLKVGSILDSEIPTMSFYAKKDNKSVKFSGIEAYPNLDKDESWAVISAGKSVSVKHSLGKQYDFETSGAGKYKFSAASATFQTSDHQLIKVKIDDVEVDVTEAEGTIIAETTTPTCDDQGNKDLLAAMLEDAKALAKGAASALDADPASVVFTNFFGGNDVNPIRDFYNAAAVDNDDSGKRILGCTDNGYCAANSGVAAWTDLVWTGEDTIVKSDIYVCGGYQDWVDNPGQCTEGSGTARGHVILHELSHAQSLTGDIMYGCDAVNDLSDPDKIGNADNFACFGSQIFKDTSC